MDKEKEAVENAARKHIEFIKSRGEKGLSVIKSLAIFEDMEKDEDSGDERKEEKKIRVRPNWTPSWGKIKIRCDFVFYRRLNQGRKVDRTTPHDLVN